MTALSPLIGALDDAVTRREVRAVTEGVKTRLCGLIREGLDLPEKLLAPCTDHYGRTLLHRDADRGYSVVAMTWGPGQGTPLHDHAGLWCVEGVWHGRLRVVNFELMEQDGERYRFERREVHEAGFGSGGWLIPPFEHHVIENPSTDEVAVSIHVYGGDMDHCSVFHELEPHWYRREGKLLSFS